MKKIRIGIIGLGNCASSLLQGIEYYKHNPSPEGIMSPDIGGYTMTDIEPVLAIDVDSRKVNKPVNEAIWAKPNCTMVFQKDLPWDFKVVQGPRLDGITDVMANYPEDEAFRAAEDHPALSIAVKEAIRKAQPDMLINYLPVGSQKATEFYAELCIELKIPFLNCIPVFIASNPVWEKRFIEAGIPLIGDDMKSQFGASILSQVLQELAFSRGHKVNCHIQQNFGGNTDFLNMTDNDRLQSKKISKENVIRSQNDIHDIKDEAFLFAGPSDYIAYYKDNKIANFRIEMEGFGGAPVTLDAKLSVQDSPNSAGVVIDAIRYLKTAQEMGIVGSLRGPSAWTQKTPPLQMSSMDAKSECESLANRQLTDITVEQKIN